MASVINLKDLRPHRNTARSQLQFRMTYRAGRVVLNVMRKSFDQYQINSVKLAYPFSVAVNALFN